MDTGDRIREVRKEYKEYLIQKNPDWSENTVKTHVSDAFFIWNNTVIPGFWKIFVDDESMEMARLSILDFLKNEKKSETYEERTRGYYRDLKRMREFFDTVHGGVKNRIGNEFDAEEFVYSICKKYYDGDLSVEKALDELCKEVPAHGRSSHKMTLDLFACMMQGSIFIRRQNLEITICLIRNIGRDYGKAKMTNALNATRENIIYYYVMNIKKIIKA